LRFLLTLSAFAVLAANAPAQEPALPTLEQAIAKQPKLRYKGQREVQVMVNGKLVKLVEHVSRDRDRSRITYPSDSPRKGFIIVEDARDRWEYNPERNEVRKMPRRRGGTIMMLRGLEHGVREDKLKAYLGTPESVAGRRAVTIKVIDGKGRLLQRLHIDEPTGLVLRAESFGPENRKLAGYSFTRVDLTPTFSPTEFEPPNPPGAKIVDRPPDFGVNWAIRTPGWLPPNFKEVGRGFRRLENEPVVMLHFSDGSKNFSVFQGRGPRPPRFGESERPGFANASRLFDGLWFVGLGRVEKSTLERVLNSIK
jgi:outer membrane lipoprotein-sorting protein